MKTLPPGYKEAILQQSHALIDWLTANNISFDDAVPVLAFTAGSTLKLLAQDAPLNERQAYLQEGIAIAIAMIRAGAEGRA